MYPENINKESSRVLRSLLVFLLWPPPITWHKLCLYVTTAAVGLGVLLAVAPIVVSIQFSCGNAASY